MLRSHFNCTDDLDVEHIENLIAAAESGDLEAKYTLGMYLDMGDYGPIDKKKASLFFKELAEKGHAHCQWIYAVELLWGLGNFEMLVSEGLQYLDLAIEGGSAEACITKAGFYINGEFEFPKDSGKADTLRKLARSYDDTVFDPHA